MQVKNILPIMIATVLVLASVSAYAAVPADPGIISERIAALPEEEVVTEETAKEAEQILKAYDALTMAEKLEVENYYKLEHICSAAAKAGYIEIRENPVSDDEARASREQVTLEESANTETGSAEYIFQTTTSSDEMSIVIHYLTDINGDGEGDAPSRIVLTSPKGNTTPLANTNTRLLDDTMDIGLVWERTFVQLDIAYAEHGKWKITTSDPVTFSRMPYAGIRQEITANDDKVLEDAEVIKEPEEKKGPGTGAIISIIALVGSLIFILKRFVIKPSWKPKREMKRKKEEDRPRKMTNEEVVEQIRREMEAQTLEEDGGNDCEYIDDDDEGIDRTEFTELVPEEYEEGDTGVLKEAENPGLSGGGFREGADDSDDDEGKEEKISSSIMDLFDNM